MHEWKPEWDQRLARAPFKQRRFGPDMMERVERRLPSALQKRSRKAWIQAVVVIVPALLLVLGGGIWFGNRAEPTAVPSDNGPGPVTQGGGTFRSGFEPGAGGDFDWWNSAENAVKQGSDRTLVTLAKALLQRQLGVWGGPTPDIWENPEVKQALERYDVSSPWVYEVYIDSISAADAQTVYSLRLGLRDSIPTVYQETIDVYVRADTQKISRIEQVSTDETGTRDGEGAATGPGEGKNVVLKEDAELSLKITGILHRDKGMIRPIHVRYGAAEKTFDDWSNVSNESYYPQAAMLPAGDGEQVLAVIMTTGYGTGVHESELEAAQTQFNGCIRGGSGVSGRNRANCGHDGGRGEANVPVYAGRRNAHVRIPGRGRRILAGSARTRQHRPLFCGRKHPVRVGADPGVAGRIPGVDPAALQI